MSKLYVFGIGGTGSRVIKALTMLLAAGVKCDVDTIVPVIIDPDSASADLTRTVETMKKYEAIRSKLDFTSVNPNQFFRTEILQSVLNYRLPLNNTQDVTFKDYMGVSTMSDSNTALVNMLFSQSNLKSDMKIGFKGNPNIGSVVLNQFSDSQEFRGFANSFQQGDKIFIVSSIFGGTGASGFPLLLKTLRSNDKIPNFKLIQDSPIGAVSVLPYFGVTQNNNSSIDSATFISKTKSALSYYERNISDNNSVDSLYYIADEIRGQYDNNEGGSLQKNDAHLIELVSAFAILDFAGSKPQDANIRRTVHKEFGIEDIEDDQQIIFKNLGKELRNTLQVPLTQFVLFRKYLTEACMSEYSHQPWAKKFIWQKQEVFDSSFFSSQFFSDLKTVQEDFNTWLEEMDGNKRRFSPFKVKEANGSVFDIVKGCEIRKLKCISSNHALIENSLNKQKSKVAKTVKREQQFVELFYRATKELVDKKYNF
ncbi:MAG: hypothetical protein Q8909_01235 [Bacteroidota bacterium]|nr:hypothetical protein [Bacteroidota bacterium]